MTCRDVIALLGELLEQTLPEAVGAELQAHLGDCPPCVAYLNTYRETRRLVGRAGRVEMPVELKERLRQFLRDQLAK
jgi:hypothetical protein